MFNPVADEAHGERSKESIRTKCQAYLERAEQLKKFLAKKGKKKVHQSGPTASKEKKRCGLIDMRACTITPHAHLHFLSRPSNGTFLCDTAKTRESDQLWFICECLEK